MPEAIGLNITAPLLYSTRFLLACNQAQQLRGLQQPGFLGGVQRNVDLRFDAGAVDDRRDAEAHPCDAVIVREERTDRENAVSIV